MSAASAMNIDYNENWTSTHPSYADAKTAAMFGFVTSQILMKLHQYLVGFDILLTTPLLKFVFFVQ